MAPPATYHLPCTPPRPLCSPPTRQRHHSHRPGAAGAGAGYPCQGAPRSCPASVAPTCCGACAPCLVPTCCTCGHPVHPPVPRIRSPPCHAAGDPQRLHHERRGRLRPAALPLWRGRVHRLLHRWVGPVGSWASACGYACRAAAIESPATALATLFATLPTNYPHLLPSLHPALRIALQTAGAPTRSTTASRPTGARGCTRCACWTSRSRSPAWRAWRAARRCAPTAAAGLQPEWEEDCPAVLRDPQTAAATPFVPPACSAARSSHSLQCVSTLSHACHQPPAHSAGVRAAAVHERGHRALAAAGG